MQKTEINIINYRLLKDLKVQFQTGNLYFVKGGNEIGKTSFINLLNDMFSAKASTDNTVSFGEEKGETEMKLINFKGIQGNNLVLKYEYGKTDKFSLIMPDGRVTRKTTEIRDIFKYQKMDVDTFFSLGLTAEGRRKQAEFIRNIIPKEINDKITEIDSLINERNGTLFEQRRILNQEIKALQNILTEKQLTEKESENLEIREQYIKDTEVLKKEYAEMEVQKALSEKDDTSSKLESIKEEIKSANDRIKNNNLNIAQMEEQIESLKRQIKASKDSIKKDEEYIKIKEKEEAKLLETSKETTFDKDKFEKLGERIKTREKNTLILNNIQSKYTDLINTQASIQTKIEEKNKVENELQEKREEKVKLIELARLPEKLSIVDNELLYNSEGNFLPFNEDNVSYAKGGKEIIRLIAEVNKDLPIIVIGKAAEYDPDTLDELSKIAKEYNMALICDYVEQGRDLEIVAYQKGNL